VGEYGRNWTLQAALWSGGAEDAIDLRALLPKPWTRSDAVDVRAVAGAVRIRGTASHLVKEGHLEVVRAELVVLWEAALQP
jgi:hypothetical protein